ncbi:MAG: cell wall-binding repeat-containing protein [Coriobacteriia bacterium]|nr:cell wall-binding repeat-containing protein [Coriobacteriia bacterium]
MRQVKTGIVIALCGVLCVALLPTSAGAQGIDAQGTTYPMDIYDAAVPGDSIRADARDVTAMIGDYGVEYTEYHTFHIVDGTTGDQDWVKFTVTSADVAIDKTSYLFRTQSAAHNLDTVIEIYGPGLVPYQPNAYTLTNADPDAALAVDQDPWGEDALDSALVFRPTAAGTYYARVRPKANSIVYTSDAGPYTLIVKRGVLGRLYGADRIQTAIQISRGMFQSAAGGPGSVNRAVVVANAYNYPDALAGSLLCGISDGPLLLTHPDSLSPGVGAEILRLGVDRVYIVGGELAVGPLVRNQLANLDPSVAVYRVEGDDRIHTACEIAMQAIADDAGYGESVSRMAFIAYAYNYPDALAASSMGAGRNVPVLLTGTDTLAADTDEIMYHLGTTDVVIVGGTSVISATVEEDLKDRFGAEHVLRIAGDNRYETAKKLASWASDLIGPGTVNDGWVGTSAAYPALASRLWPRAIGIASGETFADALPGGIAAGHAGYPLLLNAKSTPYGYITAEHDGWLPPGDTDWVTDYHDVFATGFVPCMIFGGPAAITTSTGAILDNSLMLINAP